MKPKRIEPADRLFGELRLPGDKSISHRAVMTGAIAKGETRVVGLLDCDDCSYTIRAFRDMGISIEREGDITAIKGKGLRGLREPGAPIYVGNSGTTMRLLAGILAGQKFEATLAGDESLSHRPMRRIVEPLSLMGAGIKARDGEYPPLTIKGGALRPVDYKLPIPSAQIKSAILFAGLYAKGTTRVKEVFKSRDHTERILKYFGSRLKIQGLGIALSGGRDLKGKLIEIPGDISGASFFIVGAILLKGSRLRINKIGINPTRAGILNLLSRMGARIKVLNKKDLFEPVADLEVEYSRTKGVVIEGKSIPGIIDELPIIFVLAALSKGKTIIKGISELRVKETDRINSMEENLKNMGARIRLAGDGIVIDGVGALEGAALKSYDDHRTCMALVIAALAAKGGSSIDNIECVNKSFPEFFHVLEGLKQ
ncbi:MAG: 3-phosphoshikimate 1-carboxyvinyltransferase [Candidatus Omnitrophota bacterium]|nr:3-phosphoshikimate 1-carboxyvinyltransferase [Candidatus Omnitrophota bacterium]